MKTKRSILSTLLLVCGTYDTILAISSSWRPIIPIHTGKSILHQEAAIYGHPTSSDPAYDIGNPQLLLQTDQDQCAIYKVSMREQFYFEYIHYKIDLPDMKEFTLCMWTKFHNHSNDHPLFSYAVGDQPRGILSWVANTPRSSYYMMNIDGHNLYRLNYPLRLNKWYHTCQSWNGHTGEWQIWVNDERVGRGFNNRLVGHVIKGHGIAISGQEQRQLGGGFLEGEDAPPGAGGMLGELTMLQLYNVALTAGKAHKDHKHHHAHHYEHETNNNVPPSTTRAPVTGPSLPVHPYLTGGQINTQVKINPGTPIQILQNGITLRHPALPPQPESPPQPLPPINPDAISTNFPSSLPPLAGTFQRVPQFYTDGIQRLPAVDSLLRPGLRFIGNTNYHDIFRREKKIFKRQDVRSNTTVPSIVKRHVTDEQSMGEKVKFIPKSTRVPRDEKTLEKRGLHHLGDGLIFDDGFTVSQGLDNNYVTGLTSYSIELPKHHEKDEEREPAEDEVKQVMEICDGCAIEPFEKALILAWRSVPKKLYSGASHIPATPICKAF